MLLLFPMLIALVMGLVAGGVAAFVGVKTGSNLLRVTIAVVGGLLGPLLLPPHRVVIVPAAIALVVALLVGLLAGRKPAPSVGPQAVIGHTASGEPIYPVVGYTSDGQPVTADRVSGPLLPGSLQRTNGMAIAALILGLTIAPLAIPFGHIARSQIRQTGERGNGMALAGLIFGYLSLASFAVFFLMIAAR